MNIFLNKEKRIKSNKTIDPPSLLDKKAPEITYFICFRFIVFGHRVGT